MFLKRLFNFFRHPSLRLRLVTIFTLLFGTLTVAFASFLYLEMIGTLKDDFDSALFNYSIDVGNSIEFDRSGDVEVTDFSFEQAKILPFPLGTALIQLRTARGRILDQQGDFGNFNPHDMLKKTPDNQIDEASFYNIETDTVNLIPNAEASTYRLIVVPLETLSKKRKIFLEIAVPMRLLESQIRKRLQFIQWGLPTVLILSLLGALYFSSRALRPISDIIKIANSMNPQDLSQRIPVPHNKDEIRTLVETLNNLFERLQSAYLSQERFVADASHQLLTPISLVRAHLDLLKPKVDLSLQEDFRTSIEQIDNLARIVQQMLVLARIDAGKDNLQPAMISSDEILFEALSQTEKFAAQKEIQFRLEFKNDGAAEVPTVMGELDLLVHLIRNLLENAIKYSPRQSNILLKLNWDDEDVMISVEDQGPGIPPHIIDSIFDRFNRGLHSNQSTPGFGLGLSISLKIAQLHKGVLYCENTGSGSRFTLKLKTAPSACGSRRQ